MRPPEIRDRCSVFCFNYRYDPLNRITAATDNTSKFNLSNISYDKNGNIQTLKREGWTVQNPSLANNTGFGTMDDLTYSYQLNSNKLAKVADAATIDQYGFKDDAVNTVADTADDYSYDLNGNLLSDANKGITSVLYNHLNMPTKITVAGTNAGILDYTYSADGIKLQKKKTQNSIVTTTDYANDYIYENNVLKQFYHPEGYVEPDGSSYQYVYQLKDHLGNTRITFADDNNSGNVNSSEIRREQNYYPFGLEHKGYNGSMYGVKSNLKTYQDQEFTEDLGLNTHEWKYRISDPAIGRFWQIDPLAEDYVYNGVYNFSENRVIDGWELEGLEFYPMNSPSTASSHVNEIRKGPLKKEFEVAGAVTFVGGLAAFAAVAVGIEASIAFVVNEAKDEVLSQATGGASDILDISKIVKNVAEAGIKKVLKNADAVAEGKMFEAAELSKAINEGKNVSSQTRLVPLNGIGNVNGNRTNVDQLIKNNDGSFEIIENKLTSKTRQSVGQNAAERQVKKGNGLFEVRSARPSQGLSVGDRIKALRFNRVNKRD